MTTGFLQIVALLTTVVLLFGTQSLRAQVKMGVQATNSAFSMPLGQGLDFVHSAEPLGRGYFRLRALNQSQSVTLPALGGGTTYTGQYGIGYGLSDGIDLTLLVPFLLDSGGGLNKYGTGDPVLGLKFSNPSVIQSQYHRAFMVQIGLPLGYKGEHALDQVVGVRKYSNEALDTGFQFLFDMHFDFVSLFFNGGFFRSGNPEVLPQLAYGIGSEFGKRKRWASLNMEYQARIAMSDQSRAASVFKIGTRIRLFRGIEIELNRELGFHDHPASTTTLGIRTHGSLSGQRRFEARSALYVPPPKPKRIYAPDRILRLAILDFEGFEDFNAGRRLVDRIRAQLAPHDSLKVIDVRKYDGVPQSGMLSTAEGMAIGHAIGADVVVSGQVFDYRVERFAGLKIPYLLEVPETAVDVALRYRVMWFTGPEKTEGESFTEIVLGRGLVRKRVRLLPVDPQDITVQRTAREMSEVHTAALFDLADNLLMSMASKFTWLPPEFDEHENN